MIRPAAARRTRRQLIPVAGAVLAACSAAGTALAGGGGIDVPDPPKVTDAYCVEQCADIRVAAAGSKVELAGRNLDAVEAVSFNGADGRVRVEPGRVTSRSVTARVPDEATTGRPRVKDAYGNSSTAPERIRIVAPEGDP